MSDRAIVRADLHEVVDGHVGHEDGLGEFREGGPAGGGLVGNRSAGQRGELVCGGRERERGCAEGGVGCKHGGCGGRDYRAAEEHGGAVGGGADVFWCGAAVGVKGEDGDEAGGVGGWIAFDGGDEGGGVRVEERVGDGVDGPDRRGGLGEVKGREKGLRERDQPVGRDPVASDTSFGAGIGDAGEGFLDRESGCVGKVAKGGDGGTERGESCGGGFGNAEEGDGIRPCICGNEQLAQRSVPG